MTAEEVWDKHFANWVIAGQIKRNAIPAMEEYASEVEGKHIVDFFTWYRINGELYVDKSIKFMVKQYLKEKNKA
jgi:hypothetical protein